ncbi:MULTISPECIES: methyltransferase domain-containing protein [Vibrio]|uniref:methyltransferase domain-containing protein n=1 Tax=Vibrio TaxID=662 RepID=UPI000B5CBE24|nr:MULTISPECIES: methyltransferase domain-containing protein [Vibrio]HBV75439.1 methyltransferase domain-containing protein [Vibrio sp.]
MSQTIAVYNEKAVQFVEQYDSVTFESVHRSWQEYWPQSGYNVLDIGAGSGRDSRWFVNQGCAVVAVEPCDNLRLLGQQNSPDSIQWFGDYLPDLVGVEALARQFDLILLSAVWMYIPVELRPASLKALAEQLNAQGKIVITLRHGDFDDGREGYDVSIKEIESLANQVGLVICQQSGSDDVLQRNSVIWETVVLSQQN